jgi:5-methylcytosine-specific restriction endonuclease McrA
MFYDDEPKRTKPTKALKKMIFVRDKGVCRVCNERVDPFNFEVAHDIAHSKGGKLTLQNSILLCSLCNKSMRTLTLKQMRKQLGLPEPENAQDKTKKALNKLKPKRAKIPSQKSRY